MLKIMPTRIHIFFFQKQNTRDSNSWPTYIRTAVSLLINASLVVLISLVVWQKSTDQYDISDSGNQLRSAYVYERLPHRAKLTELPPPSGKFLVISLSKPNIIVIPGVVCILTVVSYVAQTFISHQTLKRAQLNGTYSALERTVFGQLYIHKHEKYLNELIGYHREIFVTAVRSSTILAFNPSGVSVCFLTERFRSTYQKIIDLMKNISATSSGATNDELLKVLRFRRDVRSHPLC
jgi:hypothetical protein